MRCDIDWDEQPTFFSVSARRAKKPHKCSECRRTITKGEPYEYVAGLWDGDFNQYKTCSICLELRAYMFAHIPCFCSSYGYLQSDALETLSEYASECVGLFFGAGRLIVKARKLRKVEVIK